VLFSSEGDPPGPVGSSPEPTTTMSRVDLARIQAELPYPIAPVYLLLQDQSPAQAEGLPVPAPLPELSEGPHLSYAIQWFIFSLIGLIGYPIILRRQAYGRDRSADDDWPTEVTNTTDEQQTARQNGAAQGTIV
jgi:SURF1 family